MIHILNAVFVLFSFYLAVGCFERGNNTMGWFNMAASAANLVSLLFWILP